MLYCKYVMTAFYSLSFLHFSFLPSSTFFGSSLLVYFLISSPPYLISFIIRPLHVPYTMRLASLFISLSLLRVPIYLCILVYLYHVFSIYRTRYTSVNASLTHLLSTGCVMLLITQPFFTLYKPQ